MKPSHSRQRICLSSLPIGKSAQISDLSRLEPKTRQRIAALGLTRGTRITMLCRAPSDDPIAVGIEGYTLSLRKHDADRILLDRAGSDTVQIKPHAARHRSACAVTNRAVRLTQRAISQDENCKTCKNCAKRTRPNEQARYKTLAALVGNPNCGKTTLFNAITGAHESVGNYPGITVECKERHFSAGEFQICLADLPGIYSLTDDAAEERNAKAFLLGAKPDIIINIVDASNLRRNLFLTMQLCALGIPTLLALNMMDEAEQLGIVIDPIRLSEQLGIPVVPICARKGTGLDSLLACLESLLSDLQKDEPQTIQQSVPSDAEAIYESIDHILMGATAASEQIRQTDARIDRVLMHRIFGIPIFLALMSLVFLITFDTVGAFLSDGMDHLLQNGLQPLIAAGLSSLHAPQLLQSFVLSGVIGGIGSVLTFLPQVTLLFFFLSLLEDSGYLSRAAFLTDRTMRRFGLSGKACVPLLMGFGCTVPAALATRTMERESDRRMTLFLLPYISCSAKLPVYGMIASALFPKHRGFVVLSLYLLGIGVGAVVGFLLRDTAFSREDSAFLLELPPYRRPTMRSTLLHVYDRAEHFVRRAGTLILLMNLVLWVLLHLGPTLKLTDDPSHSLLGLVGTRIAPVFSPLGFGHWQAAVSLLTGLAAKEAVTASLTMFSSTAGMTLQALFSPASAYAFLTFVLLSLPCVAAVTTIVQEWKDRRCTVLFLLLQSGVAYLVSYLVYTALRIAGL